MNLYRYNTVLKTKMKQGVTHGFSSAGCRAARLLACEVSMQDQFTQQVGRNGRLSHLRRAISG